MKTKTWIVAPVLLALVAVVLVTVTVSRTGVEPTRASERVSALDVYRQEQGNRPEVEIRGSEAAISSASPLATLAGARILMAGGNAIDAAVAVGAALNVTWSHMNHLGGDTVMLIYLASSNDLVTVDAYSKVPADPRLRDMLAALPGVKGNREALQEEPSGSRGAPRPRGDGVLVAMVPGTAAAWTRAIEKFGTKPLSEVFAPAIDYAEKGFPVNTALARAIQSAAPMLEKYPSSAKIFLPNGKPLRAGDMLVQKDLARTFRELAAGGFDAFYKGSIAKTLVSYVQSKGGVITMQDMANYDVAMREPYATTYRGYDVVGAPPPTAAIHVLQQLNIVEQFDLAAMGYHSADMLHVMIEATKLAGADRRGFGGDPDFVTMPVKGLLSKKYAIERKKLIDLTKAMEPRYPVGTAPMYESEDTTHFVVVDKWGNMVSVTTTIGGSFGSKEVIEGTGILMQDRTWWMALEGPSPNIVAPNRRANIGHSPIAVLKDGKLIMSLGSPGGDTIRQTVFQTVVNVLDFGFNIQQAIEAPRFTADPLTNGVRLEPRIAADVVAELERRGHKVTRTSPWGGPGTLEGFTIDPVTGARMGGYDPRANSIAIAW